MKAAKRFFKKAIKRNGRPELVNIDKSGSNKAAPIVIRKCKYLNNIIEQDHRNIKRTTRPTLLILDGLIVGGRRREICQSEVR